MSNGVVVELLVSVVSHLVHILEDLVHVVGMLFLFAVSSSRLDFNVIRAQLRGRYHVLIVADVVVWILNH
jgi:hypothetical protein